MLDATDTTELQPQFLFQDMWRLALQPGDVLVVRVPEKICREQADRMTRIVQDKFPDHHVLILDGGIDIGVLSPERAM